MNKTIKLKTHLMFPGTCEEAFNTYKAILNGDIVFLFRKKEDKSIQVDDVEGKKISHIILKTPQFELAGEDGLANTFEKSSNNKLVLVFYDQSEMKRVFTALSEGGKIISPLTKTFFCDGIGELIDKFGINWLIMMSDDNYSA